MQQSQTQINQGNSGSLGNLQMRDLSFNQKLTDQERKYQDLLDGLNLKRQEFEIKIPVNISYYNKSVLIATSYSLIELEIGD